LVLDALPWFESDYVAGEPGGGRGAPVVTLAVASDDRSLRISRQIQAAKK
jgi:hypothetical protein